MQKKKIDLAMNKPHLIGLQYIGRLLCVRHCAECILHVEPFIPQPYVLEIIVLFYRWKPELREVK